MIYFTLASLPISREISIQFENENNPNTNINKIVLDLHPSTTYVHSLIN